ncbi:MAG: hypothetical protein JSW52_09980 [Candidatus Coatesbacteria bacterium]|nr:MAG: hypothetical protein JSW52_09980 [Candidatus Coatesbacteria bacterium]
MKKSVLMAALVAAVALVGYASSRYNSAGARTDWYYHSNGNVQLCICPGLYEYQPNQWPSNTWLYPNSYSGYYYLYESGIWVGTDSQGPLKVSESAHNGGEYHSVVELVMSDDAGWPDGVPLFADLDSDERCDDSNAGENGPIGIEVERHGYSFSAPPKDDFIGFQYKIYNLSGGYLANVYVSRFADFDLGGSGYDCTDDLVGFDQGRQMPYMYDEDGDPSGYISIICPQGTPLGSKAYVDTPDDDAGKFQYMQYSDWDVKQTPNDWRVMYNTGPYTSPVDSYITVAFVTVSGDDLADLQANADAAMDSYPGDTGTVNIVPSSVGRVKALYR